VQRTGLEKARDALLLFVPSAIKDAARQGLMLTILALFLTVFVLPPLVVLMTAFSLKFLKNVDLKGAQAFREDYLAYVYEGFSLGELAQQKAEGLNRRLDYFQALEFTLRFNQQRDQRISLDEGQIAQIEVHTVKLIPDRERKECKGLLEGAKTAILSIKLGPVTLRELGETETVEGDIPKEIAIDDKWWKANRDKVSSESIGSLVFRPTSVVQARCAQVIFLGSIKVYKDVSQRANAKGSSSK